MTEKTTRRDKRHAKPAGPHSAEEPGKPKFIPPPSGPKLEWKPIFEGPYFLWWEAGSLAIVGVWQIGLRTKDGRFELIKMPHANGQIVRVGEDDQNWKSFAAACNVCQQMEDGLRAKTKAEEKPA